MFHTAEKHHTNPRIVIVSSGVHYWAKLDKDIVDSPNGLAKYGKLEFSEIGAGRYGDSKLLNLFFARKLNERLRNKRLIVNSVDPGFCYSSLRKSFTGQRAWSNWLMEIFLTRTSEQGSRPLIWASVGGKDNVDELRGAYVSGLQIQEPSDYVISEEGKRVQAKLWDDLIDELTKSDPSVREIVEKFTTSPKQQI